MKTRINSNTIENLQQRHDQAEATRLKIAIQSISFWSYVGIILSLIFIIVNGYSAYWALANLAGLASDSVINKTIIGLIALSLVLAANVVSMRTEGRAGAILILIGLMIFSCATSAMHIGSQLLGGHQASVNQSMEYRLALAEYETAANAYNDVLASAKQADEKGDVKSSGWIRARYIPDAKASADQARVALHAAKKTAGSEGSILAQIAAFVGMEPARFSIALALFSVILMELTRIHLAYSAAHTVRELLNMEASPSLGKHQPHLRSVA